MKDASAKARLRIMMLVSELRQLAESTTNPAECQRVEALLLNTIDAISPQLARREGVPVMALATPGRA